MKKLSHLALPLVTTALICGSGAHAATIATDGYPPPGGVTFAGSGGISVGHTGGRNFGFSGFDFGAFDQLWWGLDPRQFAMNNGPGFTAGESLGFSLADSNLAGGTAVFTGESTANVFGTPTIIPLRLTVSLSGAGTLVESTSLLGIDPTFDTSQGALVSIGGDVTVNLLVEGFSGGSWTPMVELFDNLATDPGQGTRSNFGGTFYSTAPVSTVPEPSRAILMIAGIGAMVMARRRR
jgi:hypothetical protein